MFWSWLAACPSAEVATLPGAVAPWGYPTDTVCTDVVGDTHQVIDGFAFCGQAGALAKIPVDEPTFAACADVPGDDRSTLVVFDGQLARAYLLDALEPREVVNDDWQGSPILVDF
jgi:Protein of unknown function (DUF3179)